MGSKLDRSCRGTKRSVRAAAPCEMAGIARLAVVVAAAAFRNVLRSIVPPLL
ncbi:MAG: hypothetical protein WA813_22955 [Beijerinckiaceae bacterium]